MIALLINVVSVLVGSAIGLLIKTKLNEKLVNAVMISIGACVVYMGVTGFDKSVSFIVLLLAFALGALVGTAIDIDGKISACGASLEAKFSKGKAKGIACGCIAFALVSCTGAYTINACFQAALGNTQFLLTKSAMDFIVSITMAASMGCGVLFAAVPIFLYQSLLMLFASVLSPLMSEEMLAALSNVGAIITMLIGTNMINATKIKNANLIPAIILAPLLVFIKEIIGL